MMHRGPFQPRTFCDSVKRKVGATPFPCKSAGSEGRSRQGRAIPLCPLQPAAQQAVRPRDREPTPCLVAKRPPSLSYPPWRVGSRNGRAGEASSCQCPSGTLLSRAGNSPVPPGNHTGFQGRNLVWQLRQRQYQ